MQVSGHLFLFVQNDASPAIMRKAESELNTLKSHHLRANYSLKSNRFVIHTKRSLMSVNYSKSV